MKQKGVDEDEAYRVMRKLAMDRNRKLARRRAAVIDVAELDELMRLLGARALALHARGARTLIARDRSYEVSTNQSFIVLPRSWHGSRKERRRASTR